MTITELAGVDRDIHEPARLVILTVLSACDEADYQFLLSATDLTKGNLTAHLARLENRGLVEVEKGYRGRKPTTTLRITDDGRAKLASHWELLKKLQKTAQKKGRTA